VDKSNAETVTSTGSIPRNSIIVARETPPVSTLKTLKAENAIIAVLLSTKPKMYSTYTNGDFEWDEISFVVHESSFLLRRDATQNRSMEEELIRILKS